MANTPINSDQIIQRPDVVLDPNFYVPPGLINTLNGVPDDSNNDALDSIDISDAGDTPANPDALITSPSDPASLNPSDPSILDVPQSASVFSQTIRFLPNGSTVVDVVLDVEDVAGATNYEVRMTKV